MKRTTRSLLAVAVFSAAFAAVLGAHHSLKQDFFVYDLGTRDHIIGATVTVSWSYAGGGGSLSATTDTPHGAVQFRLPGELDSVQVVVEADGYCDFDRSIPLSHRPHVGGRGLWIGMTACQ